MAEGWSNNVRMWDPLNKGHQNKCIWCRAHTASPRKVCTNCQGVERYSKSREPSGDEHALPVGRWVSRGAIQVFEQGLCPPIGDELREDWAS